MNSIVLFFPKFTPQDIESRLTPASLLMVAAPLIKAGYQVKIIDQRIDKNWQNSLLGELKKEPLLVGFSAITGEQLLYAVEVSKLVKEKSSSYVVWGGIHASLLSEQTLANPYIDFIVVGEGEKTFLELVQSLSGKQSYHLIKGLGFKKGDELYINQQDEFLDLDNLLPMPYHLIDFDKYVTPKSFASGKPGRGIDFYTSRGCPHRCGFCYNQVFNKRKWRGRSAEKVVEDIEGLVRDYHITSLDIEDDEFFVDRKRAGRIAELIIERGINIDIFTACRVNYVVHMDIDYLKLLKRAGFATLAFGVESGSPRILELMKKDIAIEQVFETIKKLKEAGINSKYYFMAGFPTETIKDLYLTTDLIQKMKQLDPGIRIPAWRVYTPYPGTNLYQLSIDNGFVPPKDLEEWVNYDFNTIKMPWVKGRRKKIIESVSFLNAYLGLKWIKSKGIIPTLKRFFGYMVNWQWQSHLFFTWPEEIIVNLVKKMR